MIDIVPTEGRLLAIDIGDKRIGLALSDPTQTVAHPLATLTRRTGKRFPLKQLRAELDTHQPVGIVLGLPLESDGSEGPRALEAREVGTLLHGRTSLPVYLLDERMTTARALRAVRDLGGSTRGRKGDVDQLAATTLLQTFLDGRRP
ncbi:MAG: Holliday junction resolvase RuvX [Gemmatimonadales bacterium]|jgi:putative Holliday junction resolvase